MQDEPLSVEFIQPAPIPMVEVELGTLPDFFPPQSANNAGERIITCEEFAQKFAELMSRMTDDPKADGPYIAWKPGGYIRMFCHRPDTKVARKNQLLELLAEFGIPPEYQP